MRLWSKLLLTATCTAFTTQSYAGAWTQPHGKGQAIVNGWYYAADKLYDNQGRRQPQADYTKFELNPYLEYGVTDWFTVGANLSLQRAHQDGTPDQTNWGVGDSEFFARARLWQQDGFVLSAMPMIKLPSPENDSPRLGGSTPDIGFGLSAGYGWSKHFADVSALYRYRVGDPEDQLQLAATLGVSITDNWMIMPQAFATYRMQTPSTTSFTQSSADDYNLVKLQLSAVYKIDDKTSLQVGGFSHVDGKNAGAGSGALIAIWKSF